MTGTRRPGKSSPRDQLRAIVLTAVMLLSIVSGVPMSLTGTAAADDGGDVEFESLVIEVNDDLTNITGTLQGDNTNRVSYLYFQLQKEDGSTIGGDSNFAIIPNGSLLTASDIEGGASEIGNKEVDVVLELDQDDSITDFDLREIDDFPAGQTDKIDQINFKIYEEDDPHVLLHETTLAVGDELSSGDDLIESDELATSNATADSTDFDSAIIVDDSVNVSGGPYENGTVSIDRGFDSDTDTLAVDGAADESSFQTIDYNSTSGELAVVPEDGSATAAEYEQLFRNVTYNHTDDRPDTAEREITFSLTTNASARTDAVYNPQTGHWYEQVDDSGISWDDARDTAADRGGYLATVTSAEENAFIRDRVRGEGWLGATDAADEGEWHWVTGPEGNESAEDLKGVAFFNQTAAHVAWTDPYPAPPAGVPGGGEAVDGEYANWNPRHEPNNKFPFRGGEDYAYFSYGTPGNTQDGQWLDASANSPNFNPEGYIVEYDESPVSGDANVLNASRNVTYVAADSEPPTADASANTTTVDAGKDVAFDASGSSDADFYEWDVFGDGTTDLTGSAPEYTFTNPGTYEVNLTVTNATSGLTDNDTIEIEVANVEKPNVVLNAPDEAERGDNVQFDGTNSTDSVGIESFEWDFGDGTVSNEVSPVHGFSETGTYTVELNVTDVDGNYNTTTHEISVVESPRPTIDDFELTSPASKELNISFTSNTSLDTIAVEIFDSDEVTPSPDDSDARLFNVTEKDFHERLSDGNYTYTNTTSGLDEGDYTARLTTAENSDGRDGGFGQESETTVSASTDTTGPSAPTNPSATAIAGGNIDISFDDVNESTVKYTIYRNTTSTRAGFENVTTVTDDNSSSYTYTDSGLTDGTTYEYNVSATDDDGTEGPNSTTVSATADPTAPTIDSANVSLANPQDRDLNITFTSDEQLATIEVELKNVIGSNDSAIETLVIDDFDENDNEGTHTYTNTSSVPSDGTYEATLTKAEDDAGNDGASGENDTVTVDTEINFTLQSEDVTAGSITADNESSYSVDVTFPADNEAGNLNVTLVGPSGTTVTNDSVSVSQDAGTITVTAIDAADLDDGSVDVIANFTDDAGNVEQVSTTVTKDTTPPNINDENLTIENPQDRDLNVTFTSNESLATIEVDINDPDGNTVTTLTTGDFTKTNNGDDTYTYNNTSSVTTDGTYQATLTKAEDDADNDGADGQSDTVTVSTANPATFISGHISEDTHEKIVLEFDQAVDVTNDTAGFTVEVGGTTQTLAGAANVSDAEANVTLELADYEVVAADNVSVSYDGTSDNLVNNDGDETGQFSVNTDEDSEFINDAPAPDTTAPSISEFNASNTGQDVTVAFDSDERLSTIEVDINDSNGTTVTTLTTGDFTNNIDGTDTYTNTSSVPSDGTYEATLTKAEDDAGNDGASGENDTVTVDTEVNFTLQSGNITAGSITPANDTDYSVDITFPADNEAGSLNVTLAGPSATTGTNDSVSVSQGAGTVTVTAIDASSLDDGEVDVISNFTDSAGNVEQANTTVTKDTTGPPAPINPSATSIAGGNISVSFDDINESTVRYTIYRNNTSTAAGFENVTSVTDDNSSSYTYTDTGPIDGTTYQYNVSATDASGTEGTNSSTVTATADATTPTIGNANFSLSNPQDQDLNITFTSDERVENISVSISGADSATLTESDFNETDNQNGTYTYEATYSGSSDGDYTATLDTAEDGVENDGAGSESDTATVDTTAPSISSFTVSNPSGQDVNVSFNSTEEVTNIDVSISGAETATLTKSNFTEINNDGTYTYEASYSGSSDGEYTATLDTAEDADGNDGAAGQSDTVTVDTGVNFTLQSGDITAGPVAASNESSYSVDVAFPTDNEAGSLNVTLVGPDGDTAANDSVSVSQDAGTVTVTGIDAADLDDGSVDVIANFTDDASNVEQASTTVTKDTTSPNVSDKNLTIENPRDRELNVTFTSNESLSTIAVEISNVTGTNNTVVRTLTKGDFTETNNSDGTYTYNNTSVVSSDGTYEATLTTAEDATRNDGASGQTATVTIDTEGPTAPQNVTATTPADGNITVRFDDVNESTVRYTIYRNNTSTAAGFEGLTTITDNNSSQYTYTDTGPIDGTTYEYNVSATDDAGNEGPNSTTVSATVDTTPPTADAGSDQTVENGTAVTFDGTNSTDNVEVESYEWDIGTNGSIDLNGSEPSHTFGSTGTYTVELIVTDTAGNSNTDLVNITVIPSISSFNVSNPSGQDVNVSFDTGTQLSNVNVSISGAENETLTEDDFTETDNDDGTHTYEATYSGSSDGEYTATLESAEDTNGKDGATEQSGSVVLNADLVSDIRADSALVSLGSDVLFDADRSSIPADTTPSYEWRIDGTVESTEPNFTHTFDATGEHTVELTIEAGGATDTDEVTITVKDREPPVVNLAVNDTEPSVNDTVHFDATSSTDNDDIDSYDWEITGEGTVVDDSGGEYYFTYEAPGTFRETVTVTDDSGNEDDRTIKITVQGPNTSVDAESIDYGTATLNSSNVTSITVSNDGTAPLNLTKARFDDPNSSFSLAGDAATSLPVIQPGSSRSIAVAFEPTVATTTQTSLTIEHNATHVENITVDLTGTGVKSNLSVDDSSQAFGEVSIGQSNTRTVTVTNNGGDTTEITDLTITGSPPESFEIADSGDLPGTLSSNETVSIDVEFDPVQNGEQTAILRIESVDGTVTAVSLTGTGSAPAIALPDGDVDFGEVGPGNETTETVRIANYGSKPFDIDSVSVTGADSSAFTIANVPDNVSAGKTATVDVTFAPEDTGDYTAALAIDSNDTAAGTVERELNGSAVAPAIDADPRNIDFGNVSVGETVSFNITIQNLHTSKSNLSIESTGITGEDPDDFAVSNGSKVPFSLEPGKSKDIQVNFTPSSKGIKKAQLQIMSNAGNEPQLDVWLSNTKTYVVVQETAADVDQNSSTVNLDANNIQSGSSFSINVSKPGTREHNASIDTIEMNTSYDGDFNMNITGQESPLNHTLEEADRKTVQYIEQSYTVDGSVFDNTSFDYRVSKDSLPADVSPEDVTFHRYNTTQDAWVTHESTLERTTSGSYLFSVDTPGFSELAISAPDMDTTDDSDDSDSSESSDDIDGLDGSDSPDAPDGSDNPDGSNSTDGSDDSDGSDGSDASGDSDSDGGTETASSDNDRSSIDDNTTSAGDDGSTSSGISLPQLSPIAWGIGGFSMFSALLGFLFMLGRQRSHPHRIAVLSGVDDRWTQVAAAVTLQERDHRELGDDVSVTSIGTGQRDNSNTWLSADGIAELPWLSADSALKSIESVDITDYESIVVIGSLPSAFDDVDESDLIRWSVPDVSADNFDADQLYEQIREDADEVFDRLEASPGSADNEDT